jgi:hypothetical protein
MDKKDWNIKTSGTKEKRKHGRKRQKRGKGNKGKRILTEKEEGN